MTKLLRLAIATATLTAIMTGCGGGGGTAGTPDRIFLASTQTGTRQVYVLDRGTNTLSLAAPGSEVKLRPFPVSATQVLYSSAKDGDQEIYLYNLTTAIETKLTDKSAIDRVVDFNPATGRVLFESNINSGFDFYAMNLDGSNVVRVTNNPGNTREASFSRDGTKVVYMERTTNWDIHTCNADGTANQNVTNSPGDEDDAKFSPDATKIVFSRFNVTSQIAVMNANGSGAVNLTSSVNDDTDPVWSPDGTKIAFTRLTLDGNTNINIINPDGSGLAALTNDAQRYLSPKWSKDSNTVYFIAQVGQSSIGRVDISNPTPVFMHVSTGTLSDYNVAP